MRKLIASAACIVVAALAACSGAQKPGAPAGGPLPAVAALPGPKLPGWIASISPTKRAQSLAQVRIIFAKPVTTLGSLEGAGPADVLGHIKIEPNLAGKFVVLTPRMIGFVPEQALPTGTRVRVTLTAGLRDLDGDTLGDDLAWTFETEPVGFTDIPSLGSNQDGETPPPSDVRPTLKITATAQVDPASLAAHASLSGGGETVPVDAKLEVQPTPPPGSGAAEAFDPSLSDWIYDLTPSRDLKKATTYRVTIAPGVAPANGNVPTLKSYTGAVRVYAPLAIVPTPVPSPGDLSGRFVTGNPSVTFDNPLDPKSVPGNVTISPALKDVSGLTSVNENEANVVFINPFLLDPGAAYTLTFGANLKDIFGQTLGAPRTVAFRNGDFTPGFWAPSGVNIFPSADDVALNFYATNVPGSVYGAAFKSVTPGMLVSGDDTSVTGFLPDAALWSAQPIQNAKPNVQSVIKIPLGARLGGASGTLAYGARAELGSNNIPTYTGLVQLTNLAVFVQLFPSHAIVMAQHLADGSPAAGATVTLYRTGANASATPCASGATDSGGAVDIGGAAIAPCYAGARDPGTAPGVMAVAREGTDWTYARVQPYPDLYSFNIDGSWSDGTPLSRGTIFTDRQMYQPGESARVTGIAYYVRNGTIVADKNASYKVTLSDPNDTKISLGVAQTDAFGAFSLTVPFSKNQALGYYSIDAASGSGNSISGGLRVAEFKPPNFKLDVTLDKAAVAAGGQVTANAKGAYLFGAPLDGGSAKVTVTRDIASLAPKGWDEFTFGPQWFWPDQQPSFTTDVLQGGGTLDKDGAFTQTVTVPADLPFPMTYSIDVDASDVSNLSVSSTQTFIALPSDGIIGLKSGFVAQSGQPMAVDVIVTDTSGKTLGGRGVHLELQKMSYTAVSQMMAGGESAQNSVQYATVASAETTPGDTASTVTFIPKDPGSYRVRANFDGAPGDASATDLQAFVVGAGDVNWGGEDKNAAQIKLDKKSYKVGDTATALVASPFARSDVYLAVVRHDVITKLLLHASGNGPKLSFKVTPAMLPNAAVEALVVRRGPSLKTVKPGSLDTLSRIGFTPLKVDLGDRYLKVSVTPRSAKLEPGASQSIALQLRDASGNPMAGEAAVMVVNESILQLTGYRPPDLVQTVFADQPISTTYADSRQQVVLQTQLPTAEKGWGYGGGFLEGAGSTRVRTNFQPLAYYQLVKTDPSGRANITFKLPDDLTTWRAMAVAIGSDDMHFGNGDATFISTKALLTNPLLPQFARPGDRIDAGVSVLNGTGADGALQLVAQLSGALTFASGDPRDLKQSSNVAAGIQALRFPMIVGTPAPTSLSFASTLGSATDAFRVPFDILDRSVTESVIESGATAQTTAVPIDLSLGGSLQITLANSVVPQFAVPAAKEMQADVEPFLDDAASRLVIASAMAQLAPRYHLKPGFDGALVSMDALASLTKMQRDDGGFGVYDGDKQSDPYETAYAATSLAFARDRGVAVNAGMLGRAKAYLAQTLADPTRNSWCKTPECVARLRFEMLWALDALGDRRNDFLSDIVAQQSTFDSATQIRLARYLLRIPGWESQGAQLADRLDQTVYRTGRYATESTGERWSWLGSTVLAQSQMLQLMLERNASPEALDGAVRALASQQCKCGWPTLYETAEAIRAVSVFAAHEKLTPFNGSVESGGKTLASSAFGTDALSQTITLDASSVHGGALNMQSRGGGVLHYVVVYTYPVPNDAAGQLAGLRVIRDVRPAGENVPVASMDLASLKDPIGVAAGNVFDVGVRLIADHPIDGVVIEDPVPAGMEAVDASFKTSSTAVVARYDSWAIDDQQIYRDRVVAYASHLEPGVYEVHYLVRSVTPGEYRWPGTRAYLRNAPEQFGRTAAAVVKIQ
jgi:uncharacterized protein YfaS (alpha-2-macroglobulin family)